MLTANSYLLESFGGLGIVRHFGVWGLRVFGLVCDGI